MIELHFPNPVRSDDGFFDRQAEWTCIERTLRARESKPIIILGERRIGKTSLQSVAAARLAMDESLNCVPLFLPDGPTLHSIDDFTRETVTALCSFRGRNVRETGLFDPQDRYRMPSVGEFWQAIEQLLADTPSQTFLICVDEFDAMLRHCPDPEQKMVLDLIQDLVEHRGHLASRLRFFLSMTSFRVIDLDLSGAPLVSKSEVIELATFSPEDMNTMVRELLTSQATFLEDAMQRLFELSAGHPYVTKLLLAYLLAPSGSKAEGGVVNKAAMEKAAAAATRDGRAGSALVNLYEVWFDDKHKGVLLLLAKRQAGVTKQELRGMGLDYVAAAEDLKRRGYLKKVPVGADSADDLYCLRIAFLGLWLRQWERYESEAKRRLKNA